MSYSLLAIVPLLLSSSLGEVKVTQDIQSVSNSEKKPSTHLIASGTSCTNLGEVENSWFKTDAQDRAALKPGQWLESDREDEARNSSFSFWKASKFNTLEGNACAYKTIQERHEFYDFADAYLNGTTGATKSKWFKAANIVTSWNAIGAAELSIPSIALNSEAQDFLIKGNRYLFVKNIANLKSLMKGESVSSCPGLTGKALDYCLVEFEQSQLQTFMNSYPSNDLKTAANRLEWLFTLPAGPKEVTSAMDKAFPSNGEEFNFLSEEHRVKFGKAVVDELY